MPTRRDPNQLHPFERSALNTACGRCARRWAHWLHQEWYWRQERPLLPLRGWEQAA